MNFEYEITNNEEYVPFEDEIINAREMMLLDLALNSESFEDSNISE